jgi:isopenicillin N synthase-like dioxygenase
MGLYATIQSDSSLTTLITIHLHPNLSNAQGVIVPNPDPAAGLYIRSREGDLIQVRMPPGDSQLAFQIGETAQVHTGGVLQATPHAVRSGSGEASKGVTRETLAVFMEPEYNG